MTQDALESLATSSTSGSSNARTPSSFSVSRSGSSLSGEYSEMSESEPEMPPPPSVRAIKKAMKSAARNIPKPPTQRQIQRAAKMSKRDEADLMQAMRQSQPLSNNKNLHDLISGWKLHGKNVGMEKVGSPAAVRRLFNLMGQQQASNPNSYYRQLLARGEVLDSKTEHENLVRCLKGKGGGKGARAKQRGRGVGQKGGMIGVAVPAAWIAAAKLAAALAPAAAAAGVATKMAAGSVASAAVPALVDKALHGKRKRVDYDDDD